MPGAGVVMHVTRRYDAQSYGIGDVLQRSREGEVSADVVPLQLDEEVLPSEHRSAALGEAAGCGQAVAPQDAGEQSVSASRQHDEPMVTCFERGEVEPRIVPVLPAEMRFRDQLAQIRILFGRLVEMRHVRAVQTEALG